MPARGNTKDRVGEKDNNNNNKNFEEERWRSGSTGGDAVEVSGGVHATLTQRVPAHPLVCLFQDDLNLGHAHLDLRLRVSDFPLQRVGGRKEGGVLLDLGDCLAVDADLEGL